MQILPTFFSADESGADFLQKKPQHSIPQMSADDTSQPKQDVTNDNNKANKGKNKK